MKSFIGKSLWAIGLWIGCAATGHCEEGATPAANKSSNASPVLCRCEGDLGSNVARIRHVLSEPLKENGLDFTEEPLENVFGFLQDEYRIPIQIDLPALEDAGLTSEEPLTINLRNVSLQSALRLMLKRKNLTYVIRDEVMIITTPEEAEAQFIACVYDVRDLIGRNQGNKNLTALVDTITSCVARETWAVNGKGAAEIKALQPGLLVIAQTQAVHEEIGKLLSLIRESMRQPNGEQAGEAGAMGRGGFGGGRGGYGMRGSEGRGRGMGMEGGMGRGYGRGMGRAGDEMGMEAGGEMGMEGEAEPTPAGGDDPFGR